MRNLARIKVGWMLFLGIPILALSCSFGQLKKEVSEMERSYSVAGRITPDSTTMESVVVILYSRQEDRNEITGYTVPADTGDFYFYIKPGTYYLAAFEDLNQNLMHDPGEPAGCLGNPDAVVIAPHDKSSTNAKELLNLNIDLRPMDRFFSGFSSSIDPRLITRSDLAKIGQITTLDDPIFAPQNGVTGYWKPLTFVRDIGFGVYFLEPFAKEKIPVLFVHGAVGTPENWKLTIEKMDRTKFQPWLYYYPSGLPLDNMANALNEIIKRIHSVHPFETLYVTAISMGGLVARSFILKNMYNDQEDYIKLFISISTPWNGHRLTAKGVETAPTAIPSWNDMVPDSVFIQSLFQKQFPPELQYYLIFSYRGDCSLFLENNDGTVELSSELDFRAQGEAKKILGINEDHSSIVFSTMYLDQYHKLLNNSLVAQ